MKSMNMQDVGDMRRFKALIKAHLMLTKHPERKEIG